MQNDRQAIPHYLVLRADCPPYVLNADRHILRRHASRLLHAFARARGAPASIADDAWNDFSRAEAIPLVERKSVLAYTLINGAESGHQLRLLTTL